jgi:hypothetical protein
LSGKFDITVGELIGRVGGFNMDLSEFDARPVDEIRSRAVTILGGVGLYVPPGYAPSPGVAAALVAAQQRLADARAALSAQYANPSAALDATPAGAMPGSYYDDGSGAYAAPSSGASAAVDAFRNAGIDPFADDDGADTVLGALLLEEDDIDLDGAGDRGLDITDADESSGWRGPASAHKASSYLDPTMPLAGRSTSRSPVDVIGALVPPRRR